MKRRLLSIFVSIPLLCMLVFLSGCTFFARLSDGIPFDQITAITLETWPSFGDTTKMQNTTLSLFSDGTMTKVVKPMDGSERPAAGSGSEDAVQEARRVSSDTYDSIAHLVASREFASLPDEIESGVLDGDFQYITVVLGSDSIQKGGLMPTDGSSAFKQVYEALQDAWEQAEPDNTEELQEPENQTTSPSLEELVAAGEAQEYYEYVQYDDVFEMEAFRTILPDGWQGYGQVTWDLASATAPARSDFLAVSPDGKAGLVRVSDIHYVEQVYSGVYESTGIASPDGTPLRVVSSAVEMAYEIPPAVDSDITNMHVTGSENADPEGLILDAYNETMGANFEQMRAQGVSITNVFGTLDMVSGTATVSGVECDFECYITMVGYRMTSPGELTTITSYYWSPFNTLFFYAPQGQLGEYMNDFDIISSNYVDNQNWLAVRQGVSAEAYRLLQEKQLQDWARANEFSQTLYDSMYYNRSTTSDYSSVWDERQNSSSYYHERWEETLTGREAWDIGGGEHVVIDGFYDTLWGDGAGNYIGSNDSSFNPGAGWNELSPLT